MKKSLIAIAVFGGVSGVAHAEDQNAKSVTLYGVMDAAIRSTTNVNPATGQGYQGFSQGLFNGNRFGVKGEEKLDNGMKAIFNLEAGFALGTGAGDQQGQLFSRASWAGLSDETYGTLTAGRQYGNFSDAIGTGDVFGERHGNEVYAGNNGANGYPNEGSTVAENGFMYQEMGYRWDNSLLYANKVGPVKFSLMHSFSGIPNGTAPTAAATNAVTSGQKATMNSAAIGYVSDSFKLSVGYQTEGDANGFKHNDVGFGANYMYAPKSSVYLAYFTSKYDAGFTRIGLGTNSMLPTTATTTARQDKIAELAANNYVTDNVNLVFAMFHDSASNVLVAGDTGSRLGEILAVDYYLSKTTDTYVAGAHTKLNNALVNDPNGGNINGGTALVPGYVTPTSISVNTVMVGLRHRF